MIICAAVTALGVVATLWGEATGRRAVHYIAKPIASTGFIAVAVLQSPFGHPYGIAVIVALALSMVGDVCLMLPSKRAFRLGLFSFLAGHVAFAAAFATRGLAPFWLAAGGAVIAIVALFVARWLRPHVSDDMRTPVRLYILVISVMVATAVGTTGASMDPRILSGAFAFWLSDIAVARNRFVAPGMLNRLWGLPLYYVAQLMLASTAGG